LLWSKYNKEHTAAQTGVVDALKAAYKHIEQAYDQIRIAELHTQYHALTQEELATHVLREVVLDILHSRRNLINTIIASGRAQNIVQQEEPVYHI